MDEPARVDVLHTQHHLAENPVALGDIHHILRAPHGGQVGVCA